MFDGEDYYHNVFDYYKKQLKVFSGKDKFNKKYEFDFSDTTFFCGSPCYNNEMYYVFSDVDTKVTNVYTIADDKLQKQFSINGIGCQKMMCEIIDGYLYYSTKTDICRIGLDGKNQKQIITAKCPNGAEYIQFKCYNGQIYFADENGIFSISVLGENKTNVVAQGNIDYFVVDADRIIYSAQNDVYTYDMDSKLTMNCSVGDLNLPFNVYGDSIYYATDAIYFDDNGADRVIFILHSCNFDGTKNTELFTSPADSWYSDLSFYENKLYCSYFTEPSAINEVIVSMDLDGSNQAKLN